MKNIAELSKYAREYGLNWAVGYNHKDDNYTVSMWDGDRPSITFMEAGNPKLGDTDGAITRVIGKAKQYYHKISILYGE